MGEGSLTTTTTPLTTWSANGSSLSLPFPPLPLSPLSSLLEFLFLFASSFRALTSSSASSIRPLASFTRDLSFLFSSLNRESLAASEGPPAPAEGAGDGGGAEEGGAEEGGAGEDAVDEDGDEEEFKWCRPSPLGEGRGREEEGREEEGGEGRGEDDMEKRRVRGVGVEEGGEGGERG